VRVGNRWHEAAVLGPGTAEVVGPAVVELPGSTLVVPPGWSGSSDADGVRLERER
jgi:N-methylhydantoinase A/oxoprolinase/acetone carboxylase beta subunit